MMFKYALDQNEVLGANASVIASIGNTTFGKRPTVQTKTWFGIPCFFGFYQEPEDEPLTPDVGVMWFTGLS